MKHTLIIFMLMLLGLTMPTACSHNDGDPAGLYGVWRLETLSADGQRLDIYSTESQVLLYTFTFQGSVFRLVEEQPYHCSRITFGSYRLEGSALCIDFSYTNEDPFPYTPPEGLGLNNDKNLLRVTGHTRKHLVLEYLNPADNVTYTYTLKKAY